MRLEDGTDVIMQMRDRLPEGKSEGYIFTIHRTKKGDTYLYWPPPRHRSPSARRRAERRAREWAREVMKHWDLED